MKKGIIIAAAVSIFAGAVIFGCDNSSEDVKDAREDVQDTREDVLDAKKDLQQAIKDSTEDYQRFQQQSQERITNYEKNIAELKLRIAAEKKADRTKYEKTIADLERKTAELKDDLREYKNEGRDNWTEFKTKFNRNMDDVGNSISNFFKSE